MDDVVVEEPGATDATGQVLQQVVEQLERRVGGRVQRLEAGCVAPAVSVW